MTNRIDAHRAVGGIVVAVLLAACHASPAATAPVRTPSGSEAPPAPSHVAEAPHDLQAPDASRALSCEETREFTRVSRPGSCAVEIETTGSVEAPEAVRSAGRMKNGYFVVQEQDPSDCPGRLLDRYYPACGEGRAFTLSPANEAVVVRIAGDHATVTGAGCNETVNLEDGDGPLVVWDPIARECRTSAGNHPGGWMGCSQQCGHPPTPTSCLTGSHWVCCDGCTCDGRKKYDRRTHTCR
jgi:hypothetical protein